MTEIERKQAKLAVLEALKKSMGSVTAAIEFVNVSRQTYYDWLKNDPAFRQAVEDNAERRLDFAESMLFKNIEARDTASIKYYLDTHGEKRGYGRKKLDITSNGETMTGVVILPATEIEDEDTENPIDKLLSDAEQKNSTMKN